MIKMLNAFTAEIDVPEVAVADILSQLNLEESLLENSIGLVSCYPEFIETGVLKAICESLPFDVIGGTTLTGGTNLEGGTMLLSLSVLTSDKIWFRGMISDPLSSTSNAPIENIYNSKKASFPTEPDLILAYMPIPGDVGIVGEKILHGIELAAGGVPVFGTTACDHTSGTEKTCTIFNGNTYKDSAALVAVGGGFDAKFYASSISADKINKMKSVITESDGLVLKAVDGMPILDYFASHGLFKDNGLEGLRSLPIMLDYNDGVDPIARAVLRINEDGHAVCYGLMPENASVTLAVIDGDDVISTCSALMKQIASMEGVNGVLLFPCLSRQYALGLDYMAEYEKAKEILGEIPFHLSYAAGEYCPMCDEQTRKCANRYHNYSLIACVF